MELIACLHADNLHGLLVASSAFDPTEKELIDDLVIIYSEAGSNDRRKEETIMLYWSEFITSCATKGNLFSGLVTFPDIMFYTCASSPLLLASLKANLKYGNSMFP